MSRGLRIFPIKQPDLKSRNRFRVRIVDRFGNSDSAFSDEFISFIERKSFIEKIIAQLVNRLIVNQRFILG